MKNTLFMVNAGKISPDENGGASVYFSHLELLSLAGYQIHLLACIWDETPFNEDDYKLIKPFVKHITFYKPIFKKPKKDLNRLYKALFNPALFEYYFLNQQNVSFLKSHIAENNIDLVWAEWRWTAIWAWQAKLNCPLIYAHHDWEYKLALLRKKPDLNKRFHTFQKKRIEMQLVKNVTACVSGSATEATEIQQITNKKTLYLPTTYPEITRQLNPKPTPDLIHLGGMGTTANRLGLERFLDLCWQPIKNEIPTIQLKIIGTLNGASPALLKKLKTENIQCLGFVSNLDEIMHPEAIHIIPWEFNTGTRTRIPQAFNYQQVLVATKASAACFPELINDKNCILANDLNEMSKQIINLYKNPKKRAILAQQAKVTFYQNFTAQSQVKPLKAFLKTI